MVCPPAGDSAHRLIPMLASLGSLPSDETGWAFEFKWDGIRAVCYVEESGRCRYFSRGDKDLTAAYPELQPGDDLDEVVGRRPVLDGEIVAFDSSGVPRFQSLQARGHDQATPVAYIVFDLLSLDGRSLLTETYQERRRLLEGLGIERVAGWSLSPSFEGGGAAVYAASAERGLEGVMAKRLDSRYLPGRRSRAWLKVKHVTKALFAIAGFTSGSGWREGSIGALLLATPDGAGWRYVGKVGSGLGEADLQQLSPALGDLRRADPPFAKPLTPTEGRNATWVEPRLWCEVRYTEWTSAGRLRAPVWLGLRPAPESSGEEG